MLVKAQDLHEGYWVHLSDGSRIRASKPVVEPFMDEVWVNMEINPTADTTDGMLYFGLNEEVEVELA